MCERRVCDKPALGGPNVAFHPPTASKLDALEVITDAAIEYFSLIGRVLRTYVDDYAKEMGTEDMLRHALMDTGMRGIGDFVDYVQHGVVRPSAARNDVRMKLERKYRDVLIEALNDEDTILTLEEDESGVSASRPGHGVEVIGLSQLGVEVSSVSCFIFGRSLEDHLS